MFDISDNNDNDNDTHKDKFKDKCCDFDAIYAVLLQFTLLFRETCFVAIVWGTEWRTDLLTGVGDRDAIASKKSRCEERS